MVNRLADWGCRNCLVSWEDLWTALYIQQNSGVIVREGPCRVDDLRIDNPESSLLIPAIPAPTLGATRSAASDLQG